MTTSVAPTGASSFEDENPQHGSCKRRGDLDRRLVRLDLDQRLVLADLLTLRHEPACDPRLREAFAEIRELNVRTYA